MYPLVPVAGGRRPVKLWKPFNAGGARGGADGGAVPTDAGRRGLGPLVTLPEPLESKTLVDDNTGLIDGVEDTISGADEEGT
jgi:hypothetical protein